MRGKRILSITILLVLCAGAAMAQGSGQIEGTVTREGGKGLGGVTVVASELGLVELTNNSGTYRFNGIPAGTYTLNFSLGDNADSQTVEVLGGQTATVSKEVDWDVSFADTITVYSASRRRERIVDAPASVTLITETDIARDAGTGQMAKVLEFTPGVEITQSGVNDFNLNARGFNSSLNRRVQVLVDGRDPAVPFLGSTEWTYLSNLSEAASMELVRGPSSALYGANAFNGVLNVITKSPRDHAGGRLSLAAGELSTLRADFGYSLGFGSDWYLKLNANYVEGDSFYQERVTGTEYPGLPREAAIGSNTYDSLHLGLRLDKYVRDGRDLITIEGGNYETDESGITVTGIGRVNVFDAERTFLRLNYSSPRFNILAYQNARETPNQLALASGGRIFLDTENQHVEVQANGDFNDGKIRLVGGVSYRETDIDTANDAGFQTLIFRPVDSDTQAGFFQADFQLSDNFKLVLAGRYDESSLHDSQFSPKAAVVWGITESQTLRFSYNEAFQVANYSEFFLDAPTAFPGPISSIDLSGIEAALCTPFGVTCGFGSPVRVRALGNEDLELEEITAFEVGYSGIFANKAFLTIDYYHNELENFITDLTANPFGLINPSFGGYTPPANHPAPALLVGALGGSLPPTVFPFLTNNVDGTPIFALASYTNAGAVDTQGIDLGLNYYVTPEWIFEFTYSWFDFDVKELGPLNSPIVANAPESKGAIGISYNGANWGFSVKARWVDSFQWEAGSFAGPVPSYEVVNLGGHYEVSERVSLGLNVSNLFDDEHYESFGGDLVGRRAIGTVTLNW